MSKVRIQKEFTGASNRRNCSAQHLNLKPNHNLKRESLIALSLPLKLYTRKGNMFCVIILSLWKHRSSINPRNLTGSKCFFHLYVSLSALSLWPLYADIPSYSFFNLNKSDKQNTLEDAWICFFCGCQYLLLSWNDIVYHTTYKAYLQLKIFNLKEVLSSVKNRYLFSQEDTPGTFPSASFYSYAAYTFPLAISMSNLLLVLLHHYITILILFSCLYSSITRTMLWFPNSQAPLCLLLLIAR